VKSVARTLNPLSSQDKPIQMLCREIFTQLSGTQLSGDLSSVLAILVQHVNCTASHLVCSGQLHIFASNTAHPTINDYSHEIEFANVVRVRLNNFTQC